MIAGFSFVMLFMSGRSAKFGNLYLHDVFYD